VDANRQLGLPDDSRQYHCVLDILRDLKISSINLMTNNPSKIEKIRGLGVVVSGRIPIVVQPNIYSMSYLVAKATRMGHML